MRLRLHNETHSLNSHQIFGTIDSFMFSSCLSNLLMERMPSSPTVSKSAYFRIKRKFIANALFVGERFPLAENIYLSFCVSSQWTRRAVSSPQSEKLFYFLSLSRVRNFHISHLNATEWFRSARIINDAKDHAKKMNGEKTRLIDFDANEKISLLIDYVAPP